MYEKYRNILFTSVDLLVKQDNTCTFNELLLLYLTPQSADNLLEKEDLLLEAIP